MSNCGILWDFVNSYVKIVGFCGSYKNLLLIANRFTLFIIIC